MTGVETIARSDSDRNLDYTVGVVQCVSLPNLLQMLTRQGQSVALIEYHLTRWMFTVTPVAGSCNFWPEQTWEFAVHVLQPGIGAFAARSGFRALRASGVKVWKWLKKGQDGAEGNFCDTAEPLQSSSISSYVTLCCSLG